MKNTTKTQSSKKFKKATQPQKKQESPSNPRSIPEKKHWFSIFINKYFIVSFLTTFLGVALTLQGISVQKSLTSLQNLKGERTKIEKEVGYWKGVLKTHPKYRDAYFKLALLSYQLGDKNKARMYLEKTLEIDPNYKPAQDFRNELNGEKASYSL